MLYVYIHFVIIFSETKNIMTFRERKKKEIFTFKIKKIKYKKIVKHVHFKILFSTEYCRNQANQALTYQL